MSDPLETLRQKMEAAALALDFEEAKRLRDRISLMRGGATAADARRWPPVPPIDYRDNRPASQGGPIVRRYEVQGGRLFTARRWAVFAEPARLSLGEGRAGVQDVRS